MRTLRALLISLIAHAFLVAILSLYLQKAHRERGGAVGGMEVVMLRAERPRVKRVVPLRRVYSSEKPSRPSSPVALKLIGPPSPRGVPVQLSFPEGEGKLVPAISGGAPEGLPGIGEVARFRPRPVVRPKPVKPKLLNFIDSLGDRRRIVYCLDVSASMSSGFDKLAVAKAYLRRSLYDLKPGDSFNLLAFHEKVIKFRDGMVPATAVNLEAASKFLMGFTGENTASFRRTNLLLPLREALKMGPDLIVLVTDGLPTAGVLDPLELARRFSKLNRNGCKLYAIGMGMEEGSPGAFMLERLARESGGDFELITR